ncbi:MAG TPA: rhodanese-like domain-containing protein [Candidatus Krumholzibacteria bacterium]|nr:rhodanese-like domain-containing protein [Candidatus Krumholzibacteria bacterium]
MSRRYLRIAAWGVLLVLGLLFVWVAPRVRAGDSETNRARVERMYADYREDSFAELPDLSVDEARARADSLAANEDDADDLVWLDVRDARERRISRLPDAVDRETFARHRDEWSDRPVVVYCTVGYRSGLAARELRRQGIEAWNLAGGILAWAHEGGPVLDGRTGRPTQRVHVYGWRWNLLPEGWKAVW